MTVDNFANVIAHCDFSDPNDVYVFTVIRRRKDFPEEVRNAMRSNDERRLIRAFFCKSLDDVLQAEPIMRKMCEAFNARAYFLPQVRNQRACLKELMKTLLDGMDNPCVNPNALMLHAFTAYHQSRAKRWVVDVDSDHTITNDEKEALREYFEAVVGTNYWINYSKTGIHFITEKFDSRNPFPDFAEKFPGLTVDIKKDGLTLVYYKDTYKM